MHEPENETEQDVGSLLERIDLNGIGTETIEYANFKQLFADSPHLQEQLRRAVSEGRLTAITLLPATSTLGGGYTHTDRVISLCGAALARPHTEGGAAAAWIVGHELEHSLLAAELHARIDADIGFATLYAGDSAYDYTEVVGFYLQAMRENEAYAEIAGWNAHLDIVKKNSGNDLPRAGDIAVSMPGRMEYYFQPTADGLGHEFKKEIAGLLNPDLSMPPSTEAVAEISQRYFDALPQRTQLGPAGTCDYRHYYAAMAIEEIHQAASSPIHVQLSRLQLDSATLSASGVNLSPGGAPIFIDAPVPEPAIGPTETETPPVPSYLDPEPLFRDPLWLEMLEHVRRSDGPGLGGDSLSEPRTSAKWNPDDEAPLSFSPPPGSPPVSARPPPQSPELSDSSDRWIASLLNDDVGPSIGIGSLLGKREFDDESPRLSQGSPKIPRVDQEFASTQQPDPPQTSSSAPQSQHPLYLQALNALQTHPDPELRGRAPESLQCLAAGLACEAQRSDLGSIDHVVASEHNDYLFAIRGRIPNDPANQYVQVGQGVACATPLQLLLTELDAITPPDAAHAMGAPSQTSHERHPPAH
ncbi:XVIPCD domain-containing protein [Lysobacter antibioticus]|uniref:X-Tfes XVIPCD domain-containing protein n=1 Tax=Lysobacter antibioticus TaxID=84531 RepID=A0A0S2FAZ5_LYSAN|nr:XVIPCD domain-containing protein [Lysobacter antibioticus]ALN80754.1 hypothetical protein LA76x_2624 [Lysobacter antibioticus]